MKRALSLGVIALALATPAVIAFVDADRRSISKDEVQVVGGPQANPLSGEVARRRIVDNARDGHVDIAVIENGIADTIIKARALARQRAGGLGPGHFVVADLDGQPLDRQAVRNVPTGAVMKFDKQIAADKNIIKNKDPGQDADLYIEPADVRYTDLRNARLEGYYPEGAYLKGDDYATTQRLKSLEKTATGRTGWTGVMRVYSGYPQVGRVFFRESDNVAGGITVRVPQNSINARVGDYPATLTRVRDGSGNTMSALRWLGRDGRTSSLYINQIDDASVEVMTRLAEDLARKSG